MLLVHTFTCSPTHVKERHIYWIFIERDIVHVHLKVLLVNPWTKFAFALYGNSLVFFHCMQNNSNTQSTSIVLLVPLSLSRTSTYRHHHHVSRNSFGWRAFKDWLCKKGCHVPLSCQVLILLPIHCTTCPFSTCSYHLVFICRLDKSVVPKITKTFIIHRRVLASKVTIGVYY